MYHYTANLSHLPHFHPRRSRFSNVSSVLSFLLLLLPSLPSLLLLLLRFVILFFSSCRVFTRNAWWCHEDWCRCQPRNQEERRGRATCSSPTLWPFLYGRTCARTCIFEWSRGTPALNQRGTEHRTRIWRGPIQESPPLTELKLKNRERERL